MHTFAFTCGDVNGIGPEIVIKVLNKIVIKNSRERFYFICPANIFKLTSELVPPKFDYNIINSIQKHKTPDVLIIDSGNVKQQIGKPTISSGKAAFKALKISYNMIKQKFANAIVTAPISKTAINEAGINFSGQTEMFAKWTSGNKYAMTFLSRRINAALLTIHNPLKDIPNLIKINKLETLINIVYRTLTKDLNISNPKIAVLGLNPHAGENGIIGKEEKKIIIPALKKIKDEISVSGPYSPDAFFGSKLYSKFDMIVGMYHDQILIPFKMLTFGNGVNFTAGLPIVRTSPDHGVAYDIAGKNLADESSMIQAYKYACQIVINRKKSVEKS